MTSSPNIGNRDSSLDVVTRICPEWPRKGGSNADEGNIFSFVLKHKYWFFGNMQLSARWVIVAISRGLN